MNFFVGQVMPYIAIVVFTVGILYRLSRWGRARIVHNITLSDNIGPSHWPQTNGQVLGLIGAEAFLFRSLFRFDKGLWTGAWLMHFALLNILGGHIVGFYFLGKQFVYIGMSESMSEAASNLLGTTFGIIIFFALLYLLYRRLAIAKVKQVTVTSDILQLLLLIGIVSAGNFMRLIPEYAVHYEEAKAIIAGIITFNPIAIPDNNIFFTIHFFLVQVLLMVFPFSKLMHVLGMFVERNIVNRVYKETPLGLPGINAPAEVSSQVLYSPSIEGRDMHGGGVKSAGI
ncbi:respiratory nitrate reductase subunit gamma [Desulfolucanica intricata]|uniref:respiratory nitrate reductase subunit gamma n=1 Tax=Desulfolucanica intricata TaxID=1285191 RepID=UPI0008331C4C|nr:respiratory nitrate reductase subunit gamma [Desulfolucanica intricata]